MNMTNYDYIIKYHHLESTHLVIILPLPYNSVLNKYFAHKYYLTRDLNCCKISPFGRKVHAR